MANSFTRKANWLWQNAENLLIILFLATFTLNIRKVFLTPYSFLNRTFNEYMTMSFSWADALMIAVIFIYTIKIIMSQSKHSSSNLSETSNGKTIKENNNVFMSIPRPICNISRETYFLLLFIAWCFLSIVWSPYKPAFSFVIFKKLTANNRFFRFSLVALAINGFIQALIGIIQFFYGRSIGLRFFGESIVSREIPGVAKFIIDDMKHIRAYGTFPHPNIMAGFLIIPLIIIFMEILSRWKPELISLPTLPSAENKSEFVTRETSLSQISIFIIIVFLSTIGLGFILTFSRSAFLGLFIIFLFISYKFVLSLKYKKAISISFIVIIIALIGLTYSMNRNSSLFSDQSIRERASYTNVSREIILEHPLVGIGIGQFVLSEYRKNSTLEGWQYQPVHNIYLLITSELGIIGLALFLLFITFLFLDQRKRVEDYLGLTYYFFCCIMFSFLIMALFDHFFWDIKMGTLIFSLVVIFIFLRNRNIVKSSSGTSTNTSIPDKPN